MMTDHSFHLDKAENLLALAASARPEIRTSFSYQAWVHIQLAQAIKNGGNGNG